LTESERELRLLRRLVAASLDAAAPGEDAKAYRDQVKASLDEGDTVAAAVSYLFGQLKSAPEEYRGLAQVVFGTLGNCGPLALTAVKALHDQSQPSPAVLDRVLWRLTENLEPGRKSEAEKVSVDVLRKRHRARNTTGQRDVPEYIRLSQLDPKFVFDDLLEQDYSKGSDRYFGYTRTRWFLWSCGGNAEQYAAKLQNAARDEYVRLSAAAFLNLRGASGQETTRKLATESPDAACRAIATFELIRLGETNRIGDLIGIFKAKHDESDGWFNRQERAIVSRLLVMLQGLPEGGPGEVMGQAMTDDSSPEALVPSLAQWWDQTGKGNSGIAKIKDAWFERARKSG
jgi:hypothetical protein